MSESHVLNVRSTSSSCDLAPKSNVRSALSRTRPLALVLAFVECMTPASRSRRQVTTSVPAPLPFSSVPVAPSSLKSGPEPEPESASEQVR